MSKSYPELHIILHGEPGDVRALVDVLKSSARQMSAIADQTTNAPENIKGGPTRERSRIAVRELNERVHGSVESFGTSADALADWAEHMDKARKAMDGFEETLAASLRDVEEINRQLDALPSPDPEDRDIPLLRKLKTVEASVEWAREEGRKELTEYNEKAAATGNKLVRDGLTSPAFTDRERRGRDLLTAAGDIAKWANWVSLAGGPLTKIGTVIGTQLTKKAAQLLARTLAQGLLASEAATLTAKAAADLSGAKVHPLDYVFSGLKIGKAPAKKFLDKKFGKDNPVVKYGDKVDEEIRKRAQKQWKPDEPQAPHDNWKDRKI